MFFYSLQDWKGIALEHEIIQWDGMMNEIRKYEMRIEIIV